MQCSTPPPPPQKKKKKKKNPSIDLAIEFAVTVIVYAQSLVQVLFWYKVKIKPLPGPV